MAISAGQVIAKAADGVVRRVVVPVTSVIPALVEHRVLLAVFGALWVGFGAALVSNPAALDQAWRGISQLPLPIQGLVWLLFLPLMAGLWVWNTDWAIGVRLLLIAGIAGWNLLVFLPRRSAARQAPAGS